MSLSEKGGHPSSDSESAHGSRTQKDLKPMTSAKTPPLISDDPNQAFLNGIRKIVTEVVSPHFEVMTENFKSVDENFTAIDVNLKSIGDSSKAVNKKIISVDKRLKSAEKSFKSQSKEIADVKSHVVHLATDVASFRDDTTKTLAKILAVLNLK